jgi:hypothetical protein
VAFGSEKIEKTLADSAAFHDVGEQNASTTDNKPLYPLKFPPYRLVECPT